MTSTPLHGGAAISLPDVAGQAALSICESLLLALNDRKVLPEHEIIGILRDAAATHANVPPEQDSAMHRAVAALITKIIDDGNSVRRR
jgi:hypothetical protein